MVLLIHWIVDLHFKSESLNDFTFVNHETESICLGTLDLDRLSVFGM
jgi:hypothetical protein